MSFAAGARFARGAQVQVRQIADGAVLVDTLSGAVFELNAVGFGIWSLLQDQPTFDTICQTVSERYRVTGPTVVADLDALLGALIENRLITVVPATRIAIR